MRYEEIRGSTMFHSYPSVTDLMTQPVEFEGNREHLKDSYVSHAEGELSWWGVKKGTVGVEKAIREGWTAGTEIMRKSLDQVAVPRLPSIKRKRRWGDQGDAIDIHRVNAGRLEKAWSRTRREQSISATRGGSHITIVVDITLASQIESDQAMWRGATAVALAEAAILSGRSVRILAVSRCGNLWDDSKKPCDFSMAVEVKPFDRALPVDILMTICSLSGFYRTFFFRAIAAASPDRQIYRHFGGASEGFDVTLLRDTGKTVFIPHNVLSAEKARGFLSKTVEELFNPTSLIASA